LTVELPERLLTRLRPGILPDCLASRAVAEMVAWERAAVLEGRSMSEWAALTLAAAVRRRPRLLRSGRRLFHRTDVEPESLSVE
jgi:hypothetical protein